ncbi:MAG: NAD(P)-binding domain-containing protein, partial [Acidimicrobiales bacterium]
VTIGSRSKYRALEVRDKIVEQWPEHDLSISSGTNRDAASAELVILATPWDAAATTALGVCDLLSGKVVVTMANALARIGKEFVPLIPPRGSVAASVQATVEDAYVAAAFQHVPAKELGDLSARIDSDVLICSDHPEATKATTELVELIPGMRALDAGQLSNATAIEAFTAVLLQLNVRYRTRVALKLSGLD